MEAEGVGDIVNFVVVLSVLDVYGALKSKFH